MVSPQELAKELESLPPMMPSLLRLTEIVAEGDYTIKQVEEVIRLDPGLTLDSLRFANNAVNVGRAQVASVHDAVVRLGGERLFRYLYSRWLGGVVKIPLRSYGMDERRFWNHGVTVGLVCEKLAIEQKIDPSLAFTGGLLHDIGKVVLNHLADRLRIEIDWSSLPDGELMVAMETELFGVDHRRVGRMLMEHWGFPPLLIDMSESVVNIEVAHIVDDLLLEHEKGAELTYPDAKILELAKSVWEQRTVLQGILV